MENKREEIMHKRLENELASTSRVNPAKIAQRNRRECEKGLKQYIGKPGGTGKPQLAIRILPVTRFSVVPR